MLQKQAETCLSLLHCWSMVSKMLSVIPVWLLSSTSRWGSLTSLARSSISKRDEMSQRDRRLWQDEIASKSTGMPDTSKVVREVVHWQFFNSVQTLLERFVMPVLAKRNVLRGRLCRANIMASSVTWEWKLSARCSRFGKAFVIAWTPTFVMLFCS